MHASLPVWDDQSTQEWVAVWRCVTANDSLCMCVCVCMEAGGWDVAFQREDRLIEFSASPCYSSHDLELFRVVLAVWEGQSYLQTQAHRLNVSVCECAKSQGL